MRFFVWFFLLILFWLLIELSFFGILFPRMLVPGTILSLAGALMIVLDFRVGFWLAVGSGVLFDLLQSGEITFLAISILCFAYGMSFLNRRLTLVSSRWVPWFLALGAVLMSVGYSSFLQSHWPPLIDILVAFFMALPVYTSVERLTEWLHSTSLSEFRGLRHS